MSSSLCIAVLVSQAALGLGGHHESKVDCCDTCGVEMFAVVKDVQILRVAPRWRDRDNAAHRLAKRDWKCHPEIVHALVAAMLHDCEEEVREEAAESLKKLAPCLPEVHEALARSAKCDPDFCTRRQARKALKTLGKTCDAPCSVCGPPISGRGIVTSGEPVFILPPNEMRIDPSFPPPVESSPGIEVDPPGDLPSPLPGSSPFLPGTDSSRNQKSIDKSLAKERETPKRPDRPVLIGRRLRLGSGR